MRGHAHIAHAVLAIGVIWEARSFSVPSAIVIYDIMIIPGLCPSCWRYWVEMIPAGVIVEVWGFSISLTLDAQSILLCSLVVIIAKGWTVCAIT